MKRRIGTWPGSRRGGIFWGTKLLAIALAVTEGAEARPAIEVTPPVEPGLSDEAVPTRQSGETHLLASDGKRWLSIYNGSLNYQSVALGRLIGADGKPEGAPFVVDYHFTPSDLVYDGSDYVVFGSCGWTPCFTRISPDGVPDHQIDFLRSVQTPSFKLRAAADDQGKLMVVGCDVLGTCHSYSITGKHDVVAHAQELPISTVDQLVYSSGHYLVLSFAPEKPGSDIFDGATLLLDAGGIIVNDSLKSLGKLSDFPDLRVGWAAPATDGFALVTAGWPGLDLAKVDLTGAIEVKSHYPAQGYATAPALVATSSGFLLLARDEAGEVVQAFDASLTAVGDTLRLPGSFVPTLSAGPEGKALLCDSGPEALEAQLLTLSSPLVASDPVNVSIAPVGQQSVFVSPGPDGWLMVWSSRRGLGPWQYAHLDEGGKVLGKPQTLTDKPPLFWGYGLESVSRGPSGWLFAADSCLGQDLDEDATPCELQLQLVPDSGKAHGVDALGPMEFPRWTANQSGWTQSGFSIAGSEQGFIAVWSAAAEVHATRLDAQAAVIDDVVLGKKAHGRFPITAAVEGDHYRVFWWDATTEKISSLTLPFTGDSGHPDAIVAGSRSGVTKMAASCSTQGCWLLGEATCDDPACKLNSDQPQPQSAWFFPENEPARELPTDSGGPIVSTSGVALAAISDAQGERFPPVQLGVAEPGLPLEVVHTFEGGTQPTLAAKPDGRALLAYLHVTTAEGAPTTRIVTSLIHVTSDNVDGGGAGGAPATGGDDAAGSGGESPAAVEASGGEGGEPSESATTSTVGGGGCDCTIAHHEGTRLGWLAPLAWLLRRRRKPTQRLARVQRPSA